MRNIEDVLDNILDVVPMDHVHRVKFLNEWEDSKEKVLRDIPKNDLFFMPPEAIAKRQFWLMSKLLTKYFGGEHDTDLAAKIAPVFAGTQ